MGGGRLGMARGCLGVEPLRRSRGCRSGRHAEHNGATTFVEWRAKAVPLTMRGRHTDPKAACFGAFILLPSAASPTCGLEWNEWADRRRDRCRRVGGRDDGAAQTTKPVSLKWACTHG